MRLRFSIFFAVCFSIFASNNLRATDFTARAILRSATEIDTMAVFVKGDQYLIDRISEGQHLYVLVDRTSRKVDAWDPTEGQYHESTLDNPLVAMMDPFSVIEAMKNMSEATADRVGSDNVAGYAADKYVLHGKDKMEVLTYWVAPKLNIPVKFVEPPDGAVTFEVDQIREGPVADSLFRIPPGFTLAIEPGEAPPAWSDQVAKAPLVAIPYEHVMSAGDIIRFRPKIGEKIEVRCDNSADSTQFVAVPFKDGKPIENYMMDTFNLNRGDNWTKPFEPFSKEEDELVVRMNKGRGRITVRPAKAEK